MMSYNIELVELAQQPALVIRVRSPYKDLRRVFHEGFGTIALHLGESGEMPAGSPFSTYYNLDFEDLDIEFGFPVFQLLPGKGPIQMGQTPSGRAAMLLHVGPYARRKPTYSILQQWIKDNGYEPTGVAFEKYLNNPYEAPDEELRTQIGFLLKE